MGAPVRTTRDAWIQQGLARLADGGPEAVRVEPMAVALGVTKGGFYHHFADRPALLDAMLDHWEREAVDTAVRGLDSTDGDDVRATIRRAGVATFSSGRMHALDLAVREWARRDAAVRTRLRRVDERRMDFLRSQLGLLFDDPGEVEARSLLAFCLAVGTELIATSPRGRRDVLERALRLITD